MRPNIRLTASVHSARGISAEMRSKRDRSAARRFERGRRSGTTRSPHVPTTAERHWPATASASQRAVRCRATEKKHACSLKQNRVGRSEDHIVIERARIAHRSILLVRRDVGGRSDARGCREIRGELFGREDPLDLRRKERQRRCPGRIRIRRANVIQQLFADQISERLLGSLRLADLARGVALLNPDIGDSPILGPPQVSSTLLLSRQAGDVIPSLAIELA